MKRILLATLLVFATPISAQDSESVVPGLDDLLGRIDYSVPQSPAFTILGVVPDEVINPSSYRSLALSLVDGVDAQGNVQSGIAIDTKPYFLARGNDITLDEYRSNRLVRQLSRMQLSFATSSGDSGESTADRYAISLRWTPWDLGDPRLDYNPDNMGDEDTLEGCRRSVLSIKDSPALIDDNKVDPENEKALQMKNNECIALSTKNNWNANAWDVGIAGFRVENDDNVSEDGFSIWSSVSFRLGEKGQLIGHSRFGSEDVEGADAGVDNLNISNNDILTIGGRIRYGNSRGAIMIEGVYKEIDSGGASKIEGEQYLVGAEIRIMNGFWLQFAIGDVSDELAEGGTGNIYSGQVRYSFSDTRLLQ